MLAFGSDMVAVSQDEDKLKQFADTVTGPNSLRSLTAIGAAIGGLAGAAAAIAGLSGTAALLVGASTLAIGAVGSQLNQNS